MSAIGPKQTCSCTPQMSALGGVKRTWLFATHMSAFDPKQTLVLHRRMCAFGANIALTRRQRTATWVSIKDMATCRSWPALLPFVRLYAIFQYVRWPTL